MFLDVLLLAVLQGLTEFLPVSSSGHIVVVFTLLQKAGHNMPDQLALNVFLHVGTLAAILVVYQKRVVDLLVRDHRALLNVIIAVVPAALIGVFFKDQLEQLFHRPAVVGLTLCLTGLILLASLFLPVGKKECGQLSPFSALVIGIAQAAAIVPGISRSGITIVAGLACGMKREDAATFSFLIALPVIAGAGLLEAYDVIGAGQNSQIPILLVAGFASFVVGWLALLWLINWVRQGRLHWFAAWVLPLGIAVLVSELI